MGLLDDAIREHLDLKRRHGADPAEVQRAEREALGPVRRAPERAADDDLPAASGAEDEDLTAPDGLYEDEPIYDEDDEPEGHFAHDEVDRWVTEPEKQDDAPRQAYDQSADLAPSAPLQEPPVPGTDSWNYDAADAPEPASPASHHAEPPHGAEPPHHAEPFAGEPPASDPQQHGYADHTVEYDVEEALGAERGWEGEPGADPGAAEGEDVLEETPEFLQDTPDHDRLWFEQRPPRDFDFDK